MTRLRAYRAYRVLRVVLAVAWILPRYLALLAFERVTRRDVVAARWDRVHAAAARQIGRLALSLEGGFTKVAQIIGARTDVFPEPFVRELSQFHDAVPPRPWESMQTVLERDLRGPSEQVFSSIDVDAIAAASLAQVHAATLRDGTSVVIKLQYPEIGAIIPLDLGMFLRVARLVGALQSRVDIGALVSEVARFILLELDFAREVESMERMAKELSAEDGVKIPKVYGALCGRRVIVMERLFGVQVARVAALRAAGHDPARVARRVGDLYGTMIFERGFFQGDPHPGNLLVLEDGRLGLLDFGLCKELPEGFAGRVARMMVFALIGDAPLALEAARELGFEVDALAPETLRALMLSVVGDTTGDATFFEVIRQVRIERIPEDFALVARTLVLLNGLSHRLAPGRRLIQAELLRHLAAGTAALAPGA